MRIFAVIVRFTLLERADCVDVRAAGITVIIAKFQWVGVMAHANVYESTSHSDHITAAAAANDDDDDDDDDADNETPSSPHMQYFIKVVLCLISVPIWKW